jgi:murein DD-endopeptidase MepM/ murein hydrolase activator NlpD
MVVPVATSITCEYGVKGSWSAGFHTGRDYRAAVGTPVVATFAGKVVGTGDVWGDAYGKQVIIESVNLRGKTIRHGYCHLSRINVMEGQRVEAGQRIGLAGETGRTFGPHLHYEERKSPFLYNNVTRWPLFPDRRLEMARRLLAPLLRRKYRDHPKAA